MAEAGREFREAGERILRRRTIEEGLKQQEPVSEIKAEVRQRAPEQRELLIRLTESLFNPDEQLFRLTQYFYDEISEKFPEVVATGLAGSGAMGGARVRRETGLVSDMDLDVFLIVRPGSKTIGQMVNDFAKDKLKELLDNNHPLVEGLAKDFHLCSKINFKNFAMEDLRDLSTEEVVARLEDGDERVLVYFFPTYPAEVGEENVRSLLKTLHGLPLKRWKVLTGKLKEIWRAKITSVKEKHLLPEETMLFGWDRPSSRRDLRLAFDLTNFKAPSLSYQKFEAMIDSTKPGFKLFSR